MKKHNFLHGIQGFNYKSSKDIKGFSDSNDKLKRVLTSKFIYC